MLSRLAQARGRAKTNHARTSIYLLPIATACRSLCTHVAVLFRVCAPFIGVYLRGFALFFMLKEPVCTRMHAQVLDCCGAAFFFLGRNHIPSLAFLRCYFTTVRRTWCAHPMYLGVVFASEPSFPVLRVWRPRIITACLKRPLFKGRGESCALLLLFDFCANAVLYSPLSSFHGACHAKYIVEPCHRCC